MTMEFIIKLAFHIAHIMGTFCVTYLLVTSIVILQMDTYAFNVSVALNIYH